MKKYVEYQELGHKLFITDNGISPNKKLFLIELKILEGKFKKQKQYNTLGDKFWKESGIVPLIAL